MGSSYSKVNRTFSITNLILSIFTFNNFFWEKAVFSEETTKNCFGGTFDHFFRERRHLTQKTNITFFVTTYVPDILSLNKFFKNSNIFQKTAKNLLWEDMTNLRGKGCLLTKMNITLFVGNEVLNIFYLSVFSKKQKQYFPK